VQSSAKPSCCRWQNMPQQKNNIQTYIQKDHPNSPLWLNKNYIDAPEMGVHCYCIPSVAHTRLFLELALQCCVYISIHTTQVFTHCSLDSHYPHTQQFYKTMHFCSARKLMVTQEDFITSNHCETVSFSCFMSKQI